MALPFIKGHHGYNRGYEGMGTSLNNTKPENIESITNSGIGTHNIMYKRAVMQNIPREKSMGLALKVVHHV